MKKTARLLLVAVLLGIAWGAPLLAKDATTFNGRYQWSDGGDGELSAEFRPDGEGDWKVKFRFEWGGKKHSWKGTAQGDLETAGELSGTAASGGRRWVWSATLEENGVMKGSHTEVRSGDTHYATGTFEISGDRFISPPPEK